MIFNPFVFLIGRTIAQNRGVPSGTATTDGFVASVVRPPVLGIVLVSAIARNQAASTPTPGTIPAPTLTAMNPNPVAGGAQLTITGTNFGTDPTAISVIFTTQDPNTLIVTTIEVPLPKRTVVTPTTFAVTVPASLPPNQDIGVTVTVNGLPSNSLAQLQLQ